ncbi:MAG: hypothetical protein A2381_03700 [Bdellovibrionales bacterium RIFOXYB1_FULL_37_110]|nr:MAG: hypothetical protein A2417_16295 [Bdellovibrionales bacterium RIFOXYC1_FULL_37_79]OFZ54502.1 MAG: hypothetical protein A2328_07595 [Bdellovibrionales bacterium RIFOXYB2_FULL_36_6]OFZ59140.1 MAG: hypothetical protein A2381_03700 [Bdellovibrionales bacterium RIFOXYB1_FULL_37_110]OFZ64145.1 MAG: hypothetical protein A2577_14730 [Bdellovibrionales bacterium RIFOXYD1_FULL_36_51]
MNRRKTVLITGANRGIGFEAAKELAESGHRVILTARNKEKGIKACENIKGEVIFHLLDVTQSESVERLAKFIGKDIGTIDVLINNAGSMFDPRRFEANPANPLDSSVAILNQTLQLNFVGAYDVTKQILPFMNKKERADIINVSSGMGALHEMGVGTPAYRISKTALNALTKVLTAEFENTDLHINSICPGWVRTDLGGVGATRSLEEGVMGIVWIVNEEPELRGQFIRDKEQLDF